jgi:hypothetical protein
VRAPQNLRVVDDAAPARPTPHRVDAIAAVDALELPIPRRVDVLGIVAGDELEPLSPGESIGGVDIDVCAPAPLRRLALAEACSCLAAASLERGAQSSFTAGQ